MVASKDTNGASCCSTIQTAKASCNGSICQESSEVCASSAKEKSFKITKDVLKQYVCYSCTTNVNKMDFIPHHVSNDLHEQIQRQKMENEIKDFLL